MKNSTAILFRKYRSQTTKEMSKVTRVGYREPSSKYVRIEARGAFYLAVAEGGIVFKSLSTTDLKLNLIPTMVLNWLAKNGPFDYGKVL